MRSAHLKSTLVAAAAALALGLVIASPALPRAFPETIITTNGTQVFEDDVNPCSGVAGTTTITYHQVLHVTEGPEIPFHFSLHETGIQTFVPDDPAGIVYTGHYTYSTSFNTTGPTGTEVATERFIVNATGSDGSTLRFRVVAHQTFNANHELVTSFDRPSCA